MKISGIKQWLTTSVSTLQSEGASGLSRVIRPPYREMIRQVSRPIKSGENIFGREWDVLLVLDACRIDLMRDVLNDLDIGWKVNELESVDTMTGYWMEKTFIPEHENKMEDTIYICSNPHSESLLSEADFHILDEIWKYSWDINTGTVLPEDVTDKAIRMRREYPNKKMLVHYMQPHNPFISDLELNTKSKGKNDAIQHEGLDAWDRLKRGDLKDKNRVWKAYEKNLVSVIGEVERLLQNMDAETVVVTSDHGNAIGEWGIYGNGEDDDGDDDVDIDIDTDDEEEMEEITDQDELDLGSVMEFLEAATMDDRHDDPDTSDDRSEDNEYIYSDEMLDTGEFEDGYESDNQEPIMDDVNKLAQELEEETELQEELEDEMVDAFMDLLSEDEGMDMSDMDMEDMSMKDAMEMMDMDMENMSMGEFMDAMGNMDMDSKMDMEESEETVFDVDLNEFGVTDTDRDPVEGLADVSEPYDTETEYGDDDGGVNVGNEPYDPEAPGGGSDERNRMDDLEDPLEEETTYDISALLEEDDDLTVEGGNLNEAEKLRRENQELKEELGKHRQAIKILREKINETNLINSKLLYTNRLFKKFGLNDRQKMKVIESFDRASDTREAKLVYTTLAENFNENASGGSTEQVNESRKSNKKEQLVEALEGGLSSKKTGGSTTPSDDQKQILNENEGLKDRFQKLADLR